MGQLPRKTDKVMPWWVAALVVIVGGIFGWELDVPILSAIGLGFVFLLFAYICYNGVHK